jgi:hypothetical protein
LLLLAVAVIVAQPAQGLVPMRATGPIVIDGRFDEPAWQDAVEQGGFRQTAPDDGQPVSENTTFRLLYDDRALYFAVRCDDREAANVTARLTRRDRPSFGDELYVELDSRGDRAQAFHFEVNAAGVLRDGVRTGDQAIDFSWDAVWSAAVVRDEKGWSAEIEIPFSQLRFPKGVTEFHLQLTRFIARRAETASWVYQARTDSNVMLKYAGLGPFERLPTPRRLSIVPFVLGQLTRDDPGQGAGKPTLQPGGSIGVDGRVALDSELGLDFTVLPDFGQVEADQVLLNLTTFEIEFPEKRPFFLEGADLFQLTNSTGDPLSTQIFYSRRLGAALPVPEVRDGVKLISSASRQRLLGALKLTGRIGEKTNVAIVDGVDAAEGYLVDDGTGAHSAGSAPAANLLAARVNTEVMPRVWAGAFVTNRSALEHPYSLGDQGLCPSGLAIGADGRCSRDTTATAFDLGWRSAGGGWAAKGILLSSVVRGGPVHGLADGVQIGDGAKDLGWIADLAKTDGNVLIRFTHEAYGPKLDFNDTGYLRTQNLLREFLQACYRVFDLGPTRDITGCVELFDRESWDGVNIARGVNVNFAITWSNNWKSWVEFQRYPSVYDNRELRDGGIYQRVDLWGLEWDLASNPSSVVALETWGLLTNTWRGTYFDGGGDFTVHPAGRVELSLDPALTWITGDPRWVETATAGASRQYRIGLQDALAASATLRATVTLTTHLSLQVYAQLFSADVRYAQIDSAETSASRAKIMLADLHSSGLDPTPYKTQETALNMNLVARWEYLPGSVLYLVYTHGSTGAFDQTLRPDGSPRIDLGSLRRGPAQDAVLLKASYYFAL